MQRISVDTELVSHHIGVIKESDVNKPDNSTYRLTLRAPARIGDWLKKKADERGISINAHLLTTLEAKMEAEQQTSA